MSDIGRKADYVRAQPQTRKHTCHWPGCDRQVPPATWGCKTHWFKLPAALRAKVWRAYEPGQEKTGARSRAYVEVAREVQAWIEAQQQGDPAVTRPCAGAFVCFVWFVAPLAGGEDGLEHRKVSHEPHETHEISGVAT